MPNCPRCEKPVYFGKFLAMFKIQKSKKKLLNTDFNCFPKTLSKDYRFFSKKLLAFSNFLAERVTSLGKDWHRPCLRCENSVCNKVLTAGGHCEVNLPQKLTSIKRARRGVEIRISTKIDNHLRENEITFFFSSND